MRVFESVSVDGLSESVEELSVSVEELSVSISLSYRWCVGCLYTLLCYV